jgi:hemerythrin-like domain-containing protein
MKRVEALRPLSRDHHKALVAAIRLREATDVAQGSAAFLEFWREHGRHHFRVEEEVLLPCWAMHGEMDEAAVRRMLDEHLLIRRDVLRLESGGVALGDLSQLGRRLTDHVRFEERQLFPLIEEQLAPDALADLAAAMERAEAAGPASYT